MPLNEQDAKELIEEAEARYREFHDRIDWRRKLFHNDPEADPKLPAPYKQSYPFRSQRVSRLAAQYVARLDENHFTINGTGHPGDNPAAQHRADRVAQWFFNGMSNRERQLKYTFQRALAMGQARDGIGVFHWLKADDLLPPVRDSETDEERAIAIATAQAGFPWWLECPDPMGIMPIPDRSAKPGYGVVVAHFRVPRLRYIREREENPTSEMGLGIGMERDAPRDTDPSGSGFKNVADMYQIWTRDEWTEVLQEGTAVSQHGGDKHPYRMPPFSIAPAIYNHHPDPAYNWEPRLNSMLRLTQQVDYAMALFFAAAEHGMLPYWYLESQADGTPMLSGDDGQLILFDRQNVAAAKIPKGYTLKPLNHEISASYVTGLQYLMDEYEFAQPSTGRASFDASSPQPWSIRLEQAQESVEPGEDLSSIRAAMQEGVENIAMVMGLEAPEGIGEPVSIFGLDKHGNEDRTKLVTVAPADFRNTVVTLDISNTSSAEQIADIQHGLELLRDPMVPITPRYFLDNFLRVPNAEEMLKEHEAYQAFETIIKPPALHQLVVSKIGHIVRLGTDGMLVGMDGQPVQPEAALMAAGGDVQQSPALQGTNPQSQEGGETMPPLKAPGTTPLPGRPA